ncbi:MAG: response regulator transcription factor [Bacteroidales bacterium]|nr:response regulator transcription factor [Bacteroidales bacterium]
MVKTKVFLVDDHQMFREGISYVIEKSESFVLIGQASNGQEFHDKIKENVPDIVLMDISMPVMDGIEATRLVMDEYPEVKVIALSMYGEEQYYFKMVEAGAKGFVLKESGKQQLLEALTEVSSGGSYFSQELLCKIISRFNVQNLDQSSKRVDVSFTRRELEVLQLVCSGLTNMEIAEKLFLSPKTVEGHKSKLLSKTGARNTASLVIYAIKNELIKL